MFREVAHGIGVKETVNGKGTVEEALGNTASTFEEVKANAAGVLMVCKLQSHFNLRQIFTRKESLATFFTSLVRSARFGEGASLGRANTIIYNYLSEAGAFQRQLPGKYTLDYDKMESALSDLTALVLKIQATGDYAAASEFESKYSKRNADLESDMANLRPEIVPMDVRFDFKK